MNKQATASQTAELTPTQIRALKLAKDGDLHPQEGNKWTHLDAGITYAKTDRFKERPLQPKSVTTATVGQLRDHGLVESRSDVSGAAAPHGITMNGKMWLLRNK